MHACMHYVCMYVGSIHAYIHAEGNLIWEFIFFFLGIYYYFLVLAPGGFCGFCGSWWLLVASAASVASMASMAPGS